MPESNRTALSCQVTHDWIRNDLNTGYFIHGQPVIGNSDSNHFHSTINSLKGVYYIRHQLYLRSLDIATDSINWEIGGSYYSPPILSVDAQEIYSFINGTFIEAFSAQDGSSLGSVALPFSVPPLGIPQLSIQNSTVTKNSCKTHFSSYIYYSANLQVHLSLLNFQPLHSNSIGTKLITSTVWLSVKTVLFLPLSAPILLSYLPSI